MQKFCNETHHPSALHRLWTKILASAKWGEVLRLSTQIYFPHKSEVIIDPNSPALFPSNTVKTLKRTEHEVLEGLGDTLSVSLPMEASIRETTGRLQWDQGEMWGWWRQWRWWWCDRDAAQPLCWCKQSHYTLTYQSVEGDKFWWWRGWGAQLYLCVASLSCLVGRQRQERRLAGGTSQLPHISAWRRWLYCRSRPVAAEVGWLGPAFLGEMGKYFNVKNGREGEGG